VSVDLEALRTERLVLRRWREEDYAPMAAINSHPEVTPLLNRRMDAEAVATFPERTARHWEAHCFGHWAVEPIEGPLAGEMIGFVGVAYPTYLPEVAALPELGWRLSPASWGHGYATEAALAARDDAFDRLGLPALISLIHPENERSQRVAAKLGMTIERQVFNPVHDREIDVWGRSATGA
jgi:RimJ/RimL family protein N-acetyltransferase